MPKKDGDVSSDAIHKRLDVPFYIQPRNYFSTESALLLTVNFDNSSGRPRMPCSIESGTSCPLDKAPGPKREFRHTAPDLDGRIID